MQKNKTRGKDYYRSNNQKVENDENIQLIRSYYENMCSFFKELELHLISPNSKLQNMQQIYQNFLDEIKKIENVMEKILSNYPKNSSYIYQINDKKEKETSEKINPNIKLFKSPNIQLYQKYGIKLETIKAKNAEIREKIENYSLQFEDKEKNIPKRNKFLEVVSNIAASSDEFSYKLIDILLKQFNEKNKFKTIIYERAKEKFSSWVNQSLGIESSEKVQFFGEHCSNEFKLISLNINEKDKTLLQYYNQLFINLCELFTLARLCSEKDIELKYFQKGEKYQQLEMKEITNLNKIRYVNFTILPGLCVNQHNFKFAKTLVFNEYEQYPKLQFNIKIPKKNEINLNGTIKTEELNNKLKIKFDYEKKEDFYILTIITDPDIPNDDNPLYLMRYYISSINNWRYCLSSMNPKFSNLNNIPPNSAIAFDVQINGVKIVSPYYKETNEILNS